MQNKAETVLIKGKTAVNKKIVQEKRKEEEKNKEKGVSKSVMRVK